MPIPAIFQLYSGGQFQFYKWRKLDFPEKTNELAYMEIKLQ